ncbi:MAG: DUF3187 family protein [Gammaproteobacteria bacterium]|nr:DUF3187 family protein [Gammaproteobacteria bacterium]
MLKIFAKYSMEKKSEIKMIRLILMFSVLLVPTVTSADQPSLISEPLGAPFHVRDYTFPGFLLLGFSSEPSAPLGVGHSAYGIHYTVVNDYQLSPAIANYLVKTHADGRRQLDSADINFILSQPAGQSYYIDGEVSMLEFTSNWGLTNRLDFGVSINLIAYGGGFLDSAIYDFHEAFGIGQHSRDRVPNEDFMVVLGLQPNNPLVMLNPPTSGGFGDPSFFLRYAFPNDYKSWKFNLSAGIKAPLADENVFLSTGSWDAGFQLIADKRFQRDAYIINVGTIFPGDIRVRNFDLPSLSFMNLNWLHSFEGENHKKFFLQFILAEHPFHRVIDTELSDLEFQITTGLKWNTSVGVIGIGLTENLLNFNNTPDIGFHFTWGILK